MNTSSPASNHGKKLLEQVRDTLRTKHYSYRTEKSYLDWIKRFILFHEKRHPRDMGSQEVQDYITYLAVERKVSASTQNPCTEPVEVKLLAPSFSFIEMSSGPILSFRPVSPGPGGRSASPPSFHMRKPCAPSPKWKGSID